MVPPQEPAAPAIPANTSSRNSMPGSNVIIQPKAKAVVSMEPSQSRFLPKRLASGIHKGVSAKEKTI